MQTRRLAIRAAFMAMAIVATSCAANQDARVTVGRAVDSYDGLQAALRGKGSTVESLGSISQPFFDPEGRVIGVDGHEVQVFEFSNDVDALSAAKTISADGSSIGTSMVSWVEAPHFYKSGKLIVLYVGEEDTLVEVLAAVLGPQFAGAESVQGPSMETEPPAALLRIGEEEQISGIGSYCWTDPNAGIALCIDKVGLPTSPEPIVVDGPVVARFINPLTSPPDFLALSTIPVVPGDKMSLEIDGMHWWPPNPTEQLDLPLKSPHEIELSLDPGLYVLTIFSRWQEFGDVSYGFLVEVTPSQGSE